MSTLNNTVLKVEYIDTPSPPVLFRWNPFDAIILSNATEREAFFENRGANPDYFLYDWEDGLACFATDTMCLADLLIRANRFTRQPPVWLSDWDASLVEVRSGNLRVTESGLDMNLPDGIVHSVEAEKDRLIAYDSGNAEKVSFALRLHPDFALLFSDTRCVGWIADRCRHTMTTGWSHDFFDVDETGLEQLIRYLDVLSWDFWHWENGRLIIDKEMSEKRDKAVALLIQDLSPPRNAFAAYILSHVTE